MTAIEPLAGYPCAMVDKEVMLSKERINHTRTVGSNCTGLLILHYNGVVPV